MHFLGHSMWNIECIKPVSLTDTNVTQQINESELWNELGIFKIQQVSLL